MCYFGTSAYFPFRPRVFSRALGSGARREPATTPRRKYDPGRGPWHVLWGFKAASNDGKAFRARTGVPVCDVRRYIRVEPSRPMNTHVQVKKMSTAHVDI